MRRNHRIFFTLFLSVFAASLGVGLVVPLIPVYAHGLGAGAFQIGLIFGAFSLTRTLFVPLFGRLSDIMGKKPFLVLGLFLYFVLSIGYVYSSQVTQLVLIRLAQGFASAMIIPVAQAYVGVITPDGREGFTMGFFNMALFGGLSAGPILGGLVKDAFGINISFLSMAGLCLAGCLLCLVLLPPEHTGPFKQMKGGPGKSYLRILRDPAVFSLLAFRLGFNTCIGIIWAFLPLLAGTRFDLSSTKIGIIVTINVLISGLLQSPMGYAADRLNKRVLVAFGGILAAAAMLYIHRAASFAELFTANAVLGIAGGISLPALMALCVIQGRRLNGMGTVMGVMAMAHSLGMLVGPMVAGLILDSFSFTAVFITGAAVMGGSTVLFTALSGRATHG